MKITSGHAPRGPDRGDGRRRHRRQAPPEARRRAADHRRHRRHHARRSPASPPSQVTNPGAAIVYFDTATAQREAARRAPACSPTSTSPPPPGVSDDAAEEERRRRRSARHVQGADRRRRPRTPTARTSARFLDVMKYAMLGFAGIAFLVGIFLIVNTFSMLVAQRTREIGLMRAIGSSRRQVNRSVLVEALLLGVVGSVLGVGARRRPRRRPDEAHGRHGHEPVHRRPDGRLDDPGRRPGPRHRRHRPRRLPPGPPGRQGLPDGRPARRRHPGRRQGRRGPGRDRPAPHRRGRRRPVRRRAAPTRRARARCSWALGVVLTLIGFIVIGPLLAGGVVRVLGARRAADLRPGRPAGRAQRAAQPAPHGRHRRRPDDRPRAGRLPVGGRLLDGRLGHRASSTSRSARTSSSSPTTASRSSRRPRRPLQAPPGIWSTSPTYKEVEADAHHRPTARRSRTTDLTAADPTYAHGPAPRDRRGRRWPTPTARTPCRVGDELRQGARRQGRRQDRPSPSRTARTAKLKVARDHHQTTRSSTRARCTPPSPRSPSSTSRPTRCRRT